VPLSGVPATLIRRPDGLARTLDYLDGMRAPAWLPRGNPNEAGKDRSGDCGCP